jgi:phospholipid/cholesterol/gamma-HCH transport system permease protein
LSRLRIFPAPPTPSASRSRRWQFALDRPANGTVLVILSGSWTLEDNPPLAAGVRRQLESGAPVHRIAFDTRAVTAWDTALVTFVGQLVQWGTAQRIDADLTGLPEGARRLLRLAAAVPARTTGREDTRLPWLARVGTATVSLWSGAASMLAFLGETCLAMAALLRGKARFRGVDLALFVQDCGARALPIVTLISVLVGMILAFVGAVQLRQFGAQIYVADLVGIAMVREMGAMMTAIIMAGRSGAAFAAQIGTMQVNEEVDALTTMGISPIEFLVVPRMTALVLMMPLLTVYADLLGILGGTFVGVTMLDLSPTQYLLETRKALALVDFAMGLVKSVVFGVLVGVAGCLRGMQCGRSSAAVGIAVTSAVVTAIVFIIVSDAVLTVVYDALGL